MDGCAPAVRVYRWEPGKKFLAGQLSRRSQKGQWEATGVPSGLPNCSLSLNEAFHTAVFSGRLASWDLVFQGWGWKLVTEELPTKRGAEAPVLGRSPRSRESKEGKGIAQSILSISVGGKETTKKKVG